jgi:hypothetical protein
VTYISSISLTHRYAFGGIPVTALSALLNASGVLSPNSFTSSSNTPKFLAVVKACIHSAANPFVVVAKQHLRPLALPISEEMWFTPRVEIRCEEGRG